MKVRLPSALRRPRPEPCPQCGGRAIPIAYGLPGPELIKVAERGDVHIGGCLPGTVSWHCTGCGHDF
jgi:hypothetical protein